MGAWKKSLKKVPLEIRTAIDALPTDDFLLYADRSFQRVDVAAGQLAHLGVTANEDAMTIPADVLPLPEGGVWARRNRTDGYTITRRDLPKVPRTWGFESPNFGDWSRGSHYVSWTRPCYPREVLGPPGWTLHLVLLGETNESVRLLGEVNQVFNRSALADLELFFAVNLLQESLGAVSVRSPGAAPPTDLQRIEVEWELLPVGNLDAVVQAIGERLNASPAEAQLIRERMQFLLQQHPEALVTGTSGFARYAGAKFHDALVVFENVRYGNAAYVMFEDWQELSQMSRLQLLASDRQFVRIVHHANWQTAMSNVIARHR